MGIAIITLGLLTGMLLCVSGAYYLHTIFGLGYGYG